MTMTPTEVGIAVAVILCLLVLFGIVVYQNWSERRDQLESAALVQERLEALNRKRVP